MFYDISRVIKQVSTPEARTRAMAAGPVSVQPQLDYLAPVWRILPFSDDDSG